MKVVLIGGHADGRRMEVQEGHTMLRVPVLNRPPVWPESPDLMTTVCDYRIEAIAVDKRRYWVGVETHLSMYHAIQLLLDGYRNENKRF